jgi:hypothetical protein
LAANIFDIDTLYTCISWFFDHDFTEIGSLNQVSQFGTEDAGTRRSIMSRNDNIDFG